MASISPPFNRPPSGTNPLTGQERFLSACHCLPVDRPPVWLMRQAGRALPEYRKLRERYSFVQLVSTPDLATEVTLQPIRRFGFDAAILFSDILVVAEAMGQSYGFADGGGIAMSFAVRTPADLRRLQSEGAVSKLDYVRSALPLIKRELSAKAALIGFAGSPWTVANFMVQGGSSKDFAGTQLLKKENPSLFLALLEQLSQVTAEYLEMQIDAGAEAVQLFDTLGGLLAPEEYEEFSGRWLSDITARIRGRVPVIVFAKGQVQNWPVFAKAGAQVLGVDASVPLAKIRKALPSTMAVQGNLEPTLLLGEPSHVESATRELLESMRGLGGHIVNLGHGVLPEARLECIEALVRTVRTFA